MAGFCLPALLTLALVGCLSHGSQFEQQPPPPGIQPKHITIALLGGTGMAGGYILREALAQGYHIRALARTPEKLAALSDYIEIIQGNARDAGDVVRLLRGADVVVSALGPVKADGARANMISTVATGHILDAMDALAIQRYLVVSGAAVRMPGDGRDLTGWLVEHSAAITLADTLKDKQSEYELLAHSDVAWTLVRAPVIEPADYQHAPLVSLKSPASFTLRAGELARFIIDQIGSGEFIRKGPFLSSE